MSYECEACGEKFTSPDDGFVCPSCQSWVCNECSGFGGYCAVCGLDVDFFVPDEDLDWEDDGWPDEWDRIS